MSSIETLKYAVEKDAVAFKESFAKTLNDNLSEHKQTIKQEIGDSYVNGNTESGE